MSDLAHRWRALGVPKAAIDRHVSWLSGAPLRQAERDRIRALNQPDSDLETTVGKVARILVEKLALSANRRWQHKRVLTPRQRKLRPLGRRKVVISRPGVLAS